jgi:SAM-dependent methyltransferase
VKPRGADLRIGVGVALVSVCLLTTELALTRLFSVTIWYHFAFLAISVALFGTGAAALCVHLLQARLAEGRADLHLARSALGLAVALVVADVVLLLRTPDIGTGAELDLLSRATLDLLVTFVAAALPFFFGGLAIAIAVTRHARIIHALYSFDLLGAGLGCLLVIPALGLLGAPRTVAALAPVACLAAAVFASRAAGAARARHLLAAGIVGLAAVALVATDARTGLFAVRTAKGIRMERAAVEYNAWNSFSMVSVLESRGFKGWGLSPAFDGEIPDRKTLVIDMNAMTPLVAFDGDLEAVRHVSYDLSAFVHRIRPARAPGSVLVIGAGGGRDVLAALARGARRVVGVEINDIIVDDVMRGAYRDYVGGLYDRPDVEIIVDDGRGVVRRSKERFDVIHLSMVDTSAATAAGAYSLTENSLHTAEAFSDYLDHLADDGLLSVSSVTMPGLAGGAGLTALARRAIEERGGDPAAQIAVIGTRWIGRPGCTLHNVIVNRTPFDAAELAAIREEAGMLRFDVAYAPGGTGPRDTLIARIAGTKDAAALAALYADSPLDVRPATDDRPFFFYQNRLSDLSELLSQSRPAYLFGNGLFVLAKVAIVALALVVLFLIAPFALARRQLGAGGGRAAFDLAYVSCLGLGFMCVEIALIQKMTLFLGRPTYTLAVVLLVLLAGGALGSRLSGRLECGSRPGRLRAAVALLVAVVCALWVSGLGDALLSSAAAQEAPMRVAIAAGLLAPLGVLLGMPYPAGLYAISRRAPTRTPWLWGLNSATSVLGSVCAILISIHVGLRAALLVGAALYLIVLALSGRVLARPDGAAR